MMGSSGNNTPGLVTVIKEESCDRSNDEEIEDLEWSPDQEILLLYSLHGLKPVGPHKHFRMILIQERLSNAMNKKIPSAVIWKKLNAWYDMEALDEAEAEADATSSVEVEFELPPDEYGEMLGQKQKGLPAARQKHNPELELEYNSETDIEKEIKIESDTSSQDHKLISSDGESSKESDSSRMTSFKSSGKDIPKRGTKKTLTPAKDNVSQKKDSLKEVGKKELTKKEESKKGQQKEEDKKEAVKKVGLDLKKDERKDDGNKTNKKDSLSKKVQEQSKKEVEPKKAEQKKSMDFPKNQRETPKQLRTDSSKRGEKVTRSETPKQKIESKKESNSDKKKEVEKKVERKSPEKTPDSARGGKLRARKETDSEKTETPTGTKRTKELTTKGTESQIDEPPAKKMKIPAVKAGRPTRNSMEPQKPASPAPLPQKRRTRLL